MRDALERAGKARLFILEQIAEAISAPRAELSEFAPRIATIRIDPEKIGAVIGKGGETIRGMEAEFECTIDVAEDGLIKVFATDGKLGDACIERIGLLTRETQVGDIIEGRVASTTSFGAFVTLKPGTDGLIHISRLADHRVATVEEVVKRGDLVRVEVLDVQMQGGKEKISLRLLENLSAKGRQCPTTSIVWRSCPTASGWSPRSSTISDRSVWASGYRPGRAMSRARWPARLTS